MKLNIYQKVMMILIVIMTTLTIVFGVFKSSIIAQYGYDVVGMLQYYVLQSPIDSISKTIESFNKLNNMGKDYERYKANSEKIESLQNEIETLQKQNEDLTSLLKMQNENKQFNYQTATIINRDQNSWKDEFVINLGQKDGLKEGMVVVGNSGIVGKISEVSNASAKVALVSSTKSINKISATIINENQRIDGIVEGYNRREDALELRILLQDAVIKEGSNVVTSGLGQLYPAGITIGKVKKITKLDNELGQSLLVEITQNLENLRYVSVIVGSK